MDFLDIQKGFAWPIVDMQWPRRQRQSKADHLLHKCGMMAFTVCHGVLILCTWGEGQCQIMTKMETKMDDREWERFGGGDTFALMLRPQRRRQTFTSVGELDF